MKVIRDTQDYLSINTGERGKHEWYRSIVPDAQFSLTVARFNHQTNHAERIASYLDIITRLRTGHGSSKEWFERFHSTGLSRM